MDKQNPEIDINSKENQRKKIKIRKSITINDNGYVKKKREFKKQREPIRIKTGISCNRKTFGRFEFGGTKNNFYKKTTGDRKKNQINLNKKLFLASTSLNFGKKFGMRFNKGKFGSYKANSRQMDYLNQIMNQKSIGLEIDSTTNAVFLATLKQSKYNNRPVSSKMEKRRIRTTNNCKASTQIGEKNKNRKNFPMKKKARSVSAYNPSKYCGSKLGFKSCKKLEEKIKVNLNRDAGKERVRPHTTSGDNTTPLKFGSKLDIDFLNLFSK